MNLPRVIWKLCRSGLLLTIAVLTGCEDPIESEGASDDHSVRSSTTTSFVGAERCAGCHGKPINSSEGLWQSSFSKFMRDDPHRLAYQILQQPEARQMVHALDPSINTADESQYDAYLSKHCATCHASTAAKPSQLTYGVGCESCHGGASKWLHNHPHKTWNQLSASQRERQGYRDLTDSIAVAETCVGCHVGQANREGNFVREVTHDLIAAGHPALRFDLVSYFSALPKHWSDAKQSSAWNQWRVGKLVSVKACLDLLEYRLSKTAIDSLGRNPYELSEFNCFGCHRGLENGAMPRNSSGVLQWGVWVGGMNSYVGIDRVAWNRLCDAMDLATIDYQKTTSLVQKLRTQINDQLSSQLDSEVSFPTMTDFFQEYAANHSNSDRFSSWEELTQWALAFGAWLESPTGNRDDAPRSDELREVQFRIMNGLKFPLEYNSPLGIDLQRLSQSRSELLRIVNPSDTTDK